MGGGPKGSRAVSEPEECCAAAAEPSAGRGTCCPAPVVASHARIDTSIGHHTADSQMILFSMVLPLCFAALLSFIKS
jgi:hypothetical protein